MHLFLLAGQSNMAGRGEVEAQDRATHPRIWMLDRHGQWVPAADPLHFDKPVAGVGPGLAFARVLVETPTRLNSKQKKILEEFRETETGDECPAAKSFFSRVREMLSG